MRALLLLAVSILAPSAGLAVPLADNSLSTRAPRENLCSLKQPPELCKPDPSVTVEETAQRAYEFYKAFVVDGDPRKMFSLIDSTYKVRSKAVDYPPTGQCRGVRDRAMDVYIYVY